MSALARLLLARGVAVSGSSDRRTAMTDRLIEEGARVAIGHDAANLGDARSIVVSSAFSRVPLVSLAGSKRVPWSSTNG